MKKILWIIYYFFVEVFLMVTEFIYEHFGPLGVRIVAFIIGIITAIIFINLILK